jgi:hypothetical protein
MKHPTTWFPVSLAVAAGLALATSAFADAPLVTLTTFDNANMATLGSPYGSWTLANMTAGPTSFDIKSPGAFGGVYFPFSPYANALGCSNIVLTVNWTNTSVSPASSGDGIILVIGDVTANTELGYQWYNLPSGHYVLTKPLYPPDFITKGSTLDLANISYVHLQGDGGSPYSIQWQDLKLAGVMTNVEIFTFGNYNQDAQYAAWANGSSPSPTIVAGPTNWTITATGGGSDWVFLGGPKGLCNGAGQSNIALTVTISGLAAGAIINPFVRLIDQDGTDYIYTWYSLGNGHYVLNMPVQSPTAINAAGGTAGLNLSKLNDSHIGVDTGGLPTQYTISFENLSLTRTEPPPTPINIISQSYDRVGGQFTLTWTSLAGQYYTVLSTTDLSVPMTPVMVNIPSGGTTTTTSVPLSGDVGFFRIQQQ